jgi:hypothetical protein
MTLGKYIAALVVFALPFQSILLADSIQNGSFETGTFTGWMTAGDTLVVNFTFGVVPIGGTYQALISNAPGNSLPNPGYPFKPNGTYSGTLSIGSFPFGEGLATFLGLPDDALFNLANPLTVDGHRACLPDGEICFLWEGSAIKQSFTANAGDVISFDFDWLSDEGVPPPGFVGPFGAPDSDFAFVVLDGTVNFLPVTSNCTEYPRNELIPGSFVSPTAFVVDCHYQLFTATLTTSGNHYLGIGVVDGDGDQDVNSAVLIDNVGLGILTTAPEPSTWILLGSGIVAIGLVKRYKRA